ncbi:hypothetical protein BV898_16134 [Hypsibius exemplaris]|uniref:GPR158/179 extracellular domain-containing protein n=1 Tax=Hypsibius exemplaris TaxID=2072580 RepID=A0A9X6NE83_HYPEX|nr:hypothetical protein BV898_16134 [Hypsibius exemplaris]
MTVVNSFLTIFLFSAGITVVLPQFQHQHPDRFHEVLTHFRSVTGANCATRPRHDLFMSMDVVSHVPNIKDLYINPLFLNRSSLAHVQNMALNRAFFYSFLFRDAEDADEPGLMYFYLSQLADVASSPAINASAVYFDTNSSYPNWYRNYFNRTFPLFAPRAVQADDFNDPINARRYSTLIMTDVRDLGVSATSTSNYTHPLYRINEWFTSWLPDRTNSDYAKVSYTVRIRHANGTDRTVEFFGPPEPQANPGPVKWTPPYFDCGRTNKWLIAAVSPVSDLFPRHTPWRHLQRHKYVAAVVMETDLLRIDVNQCPESLGNPAPNYYSSTDRCRKRTTECEPLLGYGLKRGGYQCRCRPGYRLPYFQPGPFQGEMIERATEAEYNAKFECEKIGNIRVVTQLTQLEDIFAHQRGGYLGPRGGERPYSYLFGIDLQTPPEGYHYPLDPHQSNVSQFYNHEGRPLGPDGHPIVYGPDGKPIVTLTAQRESPFPLLPTWREFNEHVYHGLMAHDKVGTVQSVQFPGTPPLLRTVRETNSASCGTDNAFCSATGKEHFPSRPSRTKRSSSSTNNVLLATLRIMRFLNSDNCHHFPQEFLSLHGDVAYGKERQFDNQAQTALRLAHFISAFHQVVDSKEIFFERLADQPLNEHQLFAEVLANVMGDMRVLSSGLYYETGKFGGQVHFAPTAHRTSRNARAFYAEDQASFVADRSRSYLNQQWYKAVRERWKASPATRLTQFATRMRIRGDKKGSYSTKYDHYPQQYFAPVQSDGHWSAPYFNCHGQIKEWVLTYAVPFFGFDKIREELQFHGVATVTVPLPEIDLNQCPASLFTANAFKNSDRCDSKSSYCVPILGRRFEIGGYKCECKPGYEYPYNDPVNYFDGQVMESEWEKRLLGQPNKFAALKCRLVGSGFRARLSAGLTILSLLLCKLHN